MSRKWLLAIPIIIMLLFLCGLIMAILFFSIRSNGLTREMNINIPFVQNLAYSAEVKEEQTFEVNGPARLEVDNRFGGINVESGEDGAIHVRVKKSAQGTSQANAEENLQFVVVEMTQEGNNLQIAVKLEDPGLMQKWSGSAEFTIVVPEETEVDIESNFGDLELAGTTGAANLTTSFGSVDVRNVTGRLTVSTRSGQVNASDIEASDQNISLTSEFGGVVLEDSIGEAISLRSSNGPVSASRLSAGGKVTLTTTFGRITFENSSAGSLEATSKNGEVTLTNLALQGSVVVNSDFGSMRLTGVDATAYDLKGQNGTITLEGAQGKISAITRFGDIKITDAQDVTLSVESGNGAVSFVGSLGDGPHTISSDFGSVTLQLPADSAFDIDLKTDFGQIESAFEVQIQGAPDEEHWLGRINGGGETLKVSTRNGNISLKMLGESR